MGDEKKVIMSDKRIKFNSLIVEALVDCLMFVYLNSDLYENWLRDYFSDLEGGGSSG